MSGDDRNVKLQLIETVKNIKRKFQTLNQESNELNDVLNLTYKPLLEPLNKLASNSDGNDEKKSLPLTCIWRMFQKYLWIGLD